MRIVRDIARFDRLELDCGRSLEGVECAYETYGELNDSRNNAVLIVHAFSGDAHAAGPHPVTGNPGWWDNMIGPGKAFDTDRYFVISSNVLGGCSGTTGPASIEPATGRPYGSRFPFVTIRDMVRLQRMLVDSLGVPRLLTVAGGSMGGMQVLQWSVDYAPRIASAIPIATTHRHSAQQIAFNEVGRQSIAADPGWAGGDYYDGPGPVRGLAVARMVGHITYMSDDSMHDKFGRRRRGTGEGPASPGGLFEVESYLRYNGDKFTGRFDANAYLVITRAMDSFDLAADAADLSQALPQAKTRFLVLSFSSDWLYPTYQSQEIVRALRKNNSDVAFVEIPSSYGHDAFLLEVDEQTELVRNFLDATTRRESRRRTAAPVPVTG